MVSVEHWLRLAQRVAGGRELAWRAGARKTSRGRSGTHLRQGVAQSGVWREDAEMRMGGRAEAAGGWLQTRGDARAGLASDGAVGVHGKAREARVTEAIDTDMAARRCAARMAYGEGVLGE